MIPPSPQSQSMSREGPVKGIDMLLFCEDLGVIAEGRDRESIGLEHEDPGLHCLS